jgi:hypothetical protein
MTKVVDVMTLSRHAAGRQTGNDLALEDQH